LNEGRPAASSAITSPSITVSSGSAAGTFAIPGYFWLKSLSFLDRSRSVPDLIAMARNPSRLGS
jgi:hypothetical protein